MKNIGIGQRSLTSRDLLNTDAIRCLVAVILIIWFVPGTLVCFPSIGKFV